MTHNDAIMTQKQRASFATKHYYIYGCENNGLPPLTYNGLKPLARLGWGVAVLANQRHQPFSIDHTTNITRILKDFVARGFLEQFGLKRGRSYRLPSWVSSPLPTGASPLAGGASPLAAGTPPLASGASPLTAGTPPLVGGASITDDPRLLEIARLAREKPRLMPGRVKQIVRELCRDRFLTSGEIGTLMNRGPEKLREKFLSSMVASGELSLRYPDEPNHPDQAYTIKD